ncbi:TPA: hypothetical protein QH405_003847 [Klebsiella michiganensis]|nr:hypothetical protein [Klebsiella michiganensis]
MTEITEECVWPGGVYPLPDMSLDDYARILGEAMSAAALAGRNDLLEEMNGR